MKIPLYYTFGNHMHWADMEWLWGYHVLPGSVRDMLKLCKEAGVKGCVNFDGIGYEKLAVEDPEAFTELRDAIRSGTIEVVGGSYGQPYGQFHGGESNMRQRIFGARTVKRLFGVRLKTFWEEEFDYFPQLPQVLKGVGVDYASLFFQWTWHTPEVPKEDGPVVWWEAPDGSRVLTATRNKLNLHQWPEDMALTFSTLAEDGVSEDPGRVPLVQQWLELMPSPDWMCRSEVIMPKLKELLADERFDVKPVTLSEYLSLAAEDSAPIRRYGMDQVWHGLTLGKNGDNMRRLSREAESSLLSAETFAAVAGLFGRPYAQWDVYPTWELEEAWRELLSAQHHDNDECEGLCGYVGGFSYERSLKLSRRVGRATMRRLLHNWQVDRAKIYFEGMAPLSPGIDRSDDDGRPALPEDEIEEAVLFNGLGWPRRLANDVTIGPFGYAYSARGKDADRWRWLRGPQRWDWMSERKPIDTGELRVTVEEDPRTFRQIVSSNFPEGIFRQDAPEREYMNSKGEMVRRHHAVTASMVLDGQAVWPQHIRDHHEYGDFEVQAWYLEELNAVILQAFSEIARPDPGLNAGLQLTFHLSFRPSIIADQPYSVSGVQPVEKALRKYPKGDWMTSEQWFEEVRGAFTALTFVDLVDADNPDRGLLICHDGSQQWFLDEETNTVRVVLNAYDPWDEDYFVSAVRANFLLVPHGPMKNSERWKIAQEFLRPVHRAYFVGGSENPTAPTDYSPVFCDRDNVALTAFYRETRDSAKGQEVHAADRLGVDYPYVLRMVELDGEETEATLTFTPTVAGAVKTNMLGEPETDLTVAGSSVSLRLRPYEIATVYLDLVEGRKQVRDLDAKREVWATVHRVD